MNKIITVKSVNKDIKIILQKDNNLIDVFIVNSENCHAELLVSCIDNILNKNSINYNDLDYISVVNGPGSFISIKSEIAAVKALRVILKKPIITIDLFEIINYSNNSDYVILRGDFNSFYIKNAFGEYFQVQKTEIFNFLEKGSRIITNDVEIFDFLKDFNIFLIEENFENILKINCKKIEEKNFSKKIFALYIGNPKINKKKI